MDLDTLPKNPGPYTLSFGFNLDGLRESLERVGLINPPLVAMNKEGSLDIVSGYRRILAMAKMGERRCLCEDVTSVLPSALERLLANLWENLSTRKFNDVEKALILDKLQAHVAKEEILNSFMPLLSLPSHEGTRRFYLKLLRLEEADQMAIAREEISTKAAKAVLEMEEDSWRPLFKWISLARLNFNQQLKFIEYVQDISRREGLHVCEVLADKALMEVLSDYRLNTPQKAKALLGILKARRYPRLSAAQHSVERALAAITLPEGASIQYDPYLEDPQYRLEIKFSSGKGLKADLHKLHTMLEVEAIPELWAGD
ncbi:MAG: ParB N-terminal domain-containing protein [Desulfobacterota bacterium]|nr:ParB N-terminal domain-containing protein [Thermodesulfobacteriota bacterium]